MPHKKSCHLVLKIQHVFAAVFVDKVIENLGAGSPFNSLVLRISLNIFCEICFHNVKKNFGTSFLVSVKISGFAYEI